ncbi:hypothetical protein [Sphingomonas sp. SAFR-052]|uniref:hypothetical protein n=1 Tax=Sphingomonas sp. SAFR-052 TaxID=3436867 RepID=UPI003F7FD813
MAAALFLLIALPAGVAGQSVDQILAAAAEREARRNCAVAAKDEVVVCGDPDRDARYRLPLPRQTLPAEVGAVTGEPAQASVQDPFLSGCGIFRGQRRCGKAEAEAYGYGAGRDPVTLVGRLVTKLVDPDAEIGPPVAIPPTRRTDRPK